jgi:hypothetical protein
MRRQNLESTLKRLQEPVPPKVEKK